MFTLSFAKRGLIEVTDDTSGAPAFSIHLRPNTSVVPFDPDFGGRGPTVMVVNGNNANTLYIAEIESPVYGTAEELAEDIRDAIETMYQGGGGGGVDEFIELNDAPASYGGQADKLVAVNDAEDGLEFLDPAVAVGLSPDIIDGLNAFNPGHPPSAINGYATDEEIALTNTGFGPTFQYDDNTTEGDPGAGKFRLDDVFADATAMYLSPTTQAGSNVKDLIMAIGAGGIIVLQRLQVDGATSSLVITGPPVDNGAYITIPVDHKTGSIIDGSSYNFHLWQSAVPKLWIARVTDPADPVNGMVISKNTLGGTVTWTYNGAGEYALTSAGLFGSIASVVCLFGYAESSKVLWLRQEQSGDSLIALHVTNDGGALADPDDIFLVILTVYE